MPLSGPTDEGNYGILSYQILLVAPRLCNHGVRPLWIGAAAAATSCRQEVLSVGGDG